MFNASTGINKQVLLIQHQPVSAYLKLKVTLAWNNGRNSPPLWFSFIKSFLSNKQQLCISTLILSYKNRNRKKIHRKSEMPGKFLIRAIHAIWLTTSRYRCFSTYFPVFHKYPPPRSINRAKYNIQRTNSEPYRINKWRKSRNYIILVAIYLLRDTAREDFHFSFFVNIWTHRSIF